MRYCSTTPIFVSYLSFANDIIIFLNESRSSLWWVIKFLHHYKAVSGQSINQAKSCFYIGTFASASRQAIVHSITDFQRLQLPFTYLGCSIFRGSFKISHFDDMVWKIRDKISGWANQLLSFGGKLVLIRHVLLSMPLHLLHVHCPHAAVVQLLERFFNWFLCGDSELRR